MSLQDINRNIDKFSKELDVGIIKALTVVGEDAVGVIKRNTPTITSRLKNSMSYTINNRVFNTDAPTEGDDELKPGKSKKEVVVGTNVIYGPSVEFLSNKESASFGFMNRSFNQIRRTAKKTLATALKKVIK